MIESLTGTYADWSVGIVRILLGVIFLAHGAQKLLGCYGGPGLAKSMRAFTEDLHLPRTLAFLVIVGEFLGGVGLIIGLSAESPRLSSQSRCLVRLQLSISDSASF